MAETFDTILKGATIVNHDGIGARDIGIRGGRIAAIGSLGTNSAGEVIDCTGLHILPGVVDSQVHFREPGLEHKEDLETGSRAAVLGGVTAVFEMPNTKPLTTSAEALEDKVRRGRHRMHCDFAFRQNFSHYLALLIEQCNCFCGLFAFHWLCGCPCREPYLLVFQVPSEFRFFLLRPPRLYFCILTWLVNHMHRDIVRPAFAAKTMDSESFG